MERYADVFKSQIINIFYKQINLFRDQSEKNKLWKRLVRDPIHEIRTWQKIHHTHISWAGKKIYIKLRWKVWMSALFQGGCRARRPPEGRMKKQFHSVLAHFLSPASLSPSNISRVPLRICLGVFFWNT